MEVYGWQPISDLIRDGNESEIEVFDETTIPNPNKKEKSTIMFIV